MMLPRKVLLPLAFLIHHYAMEIHPTPQSHDEVMRFTHSGRTSDLFGHSSIDGNSFNFQFLLLATMNNVVLNILTCLHADPYLLGNCFSFYGIGSQEWKFWDFGMI